MKANTPQYLGNLLSNFDHQLLEILKSDIRSQRQQQKAKLINLATRNYDRELLEILRQDANFIKASLSEVKSA